MLTKVRDTKIPIEAQIRDAQTVLSATIGYMSRVTGRSLTEPELIPKGFIDYPIGYGGNFDKDSNKVFLRSESDKHRPRGYSIEEALAIISSHETGHSAEWQITGDAVWYFNSIVLEGKADLAAMAALTLGHPDRDMAVALALDRHRISSTGDAGLERTLDFHNLLERIIENVSRFSNGVFTPEMLNQELARSLKYERDHRNYDPHQNGTAIAFFTLIQNNFDVERTVNELFSKTAEEVFCDVFWMVQNNKAQTIKTINELILEREQGYHLLPLLRPNEIAAEIGRVRDLQVSARM